MFRTRCARRDATCTSMWNDLHLGMPLTSCRKTPTHKPHVVHPAGAHPPGHRADTNQRAFACHEGACGVSSPALCTATTTQVSHPLQPLTASEIQAALAVLREAGKLTSSMRVVSVMLLEPPKSAVYASTPVGLDTDTVELTIKPLLAVLSLESSRVQFCDTIQPRHARREASVSLFDNPSNAAYEAKVALDGAGGVLSWKNIPGVQPTITVDECFECEKAVMESEEFKV
eukprot:2479057-Pyramimonas_sp.AAC.3